MVIAVTLHEIYGMRSTEGRPWLTTSTNKCSRQAIKKTIRKDETNARTQ
jgi:hypothetical protein